MSRSKHGTTFDMTARQSLGLPDARGTTLRVTRGTLWITQEDDTRDVVLRPGDTWTVERQGLTIVEAQTHATLHTIGAAAERGILVAPGTRRWLHSLRRAAVRWLALTPRKPLPYY